MLSEPYFPLMQPPNLLLPAGASLEDVFGNTQANTHNDTQANTPGAVLQSENLDKPVLPCSARTSSA